jgi:hypothetical protein
VANVLGVLASSPCPGTFLRLGTAFVLIIYLHRCLAIAPSIFEIMGAIKPCKETRLTPTNIRGGWEARVRSDDRIVTWRSAGFSSGDSGTECNQLQKGGYPFSGTNRSHDQSLEVVWCNQLQKPVPNRCLSGRGVQSIANP